MLEKKITVSKPEGEYAAMLATLVQHACKYESKIYLETGDKKVNAKSIMGMMNLSVYDGGEITISAEGFDEEAAVKDIEGFLTNK